MSLENCSSRAEQVSIGSLLAFKVFLRLTKNIVNVNPTPPAGPAKKNGSGLNAGDKISLGLGISFGLPGIIATAIGSYYARKALKSRQGVSGTSVGTSPTGTARRQARTPASNTSVSTSQAPMSESISNVAPPENARALVDSPASRIPALQTHTSHPSASQIAAPVPPQSINSGTPPTHLPPPPPTAPTV
jgi:hypothetical protein